MMRMSDVLKRERTSPSFRYPPAPPGQALYVIGDIHGRSDLLKIVQSRIDLDVRCMPDDRRPTEIYLGDYVDRGPDSRGVLEMLIERKKARQAILLRGNHEQMLQRCLAGELTFGDWARHGGRQTAASYGIVTRLLYSSKDDEAIKKALLKAIPKEHLTLIQQLSDLECIGDYAFVHAGISPLRSLADQTTAECLWIRKAFLQHTRPFEKIVVHGHTPVRAVEFLSNRINVDTGGFATNRLSCVKIDAAGARLLCDSLSESVISADRLEDDASGCVPLPAPALRCSVGPAGGGAHRD